MNFLHPIMLGALAAAAYAIPASRLRNHFGHSQAAHAALTRAHAAAHGQPRAREQDA